MNQKAACSSHAGRTIKINSSQETLKSGKIKSKQKVSMPALNPMPHCMINGGKIRNALLFLLALTKDFKRFLYKMLNKSLFRLMPI